MFSFKKSLIALLGVLALVGVLGALMPLVSRGQGQGGNPLTQDPRRSFYLTQTIHNGGQALTACAAGYHMASLWEIFDTSNLRYDTQLGMTLADSGFGPPDTLSGWIRTGFDANNGSTPGRANCNVWTSDNGADRGTVVALLSIWDPSVIEAAIHPWNTSVNACNFNTRVWCVQD